MQGPAEQTAAPTAHGLGDTYQLLAKLSEGGMGAIYKVRHRHLNQVRVIKVMRGQFEDHEGFQARFLREAQLAAQISHPNVAQLHEYAMTPGGLAYMVMEFIDGLTVEQLLKGSGPASVALGLEVARQALGALGSLHEHGSIHRDVSPDNLMLTRDARGRLQVKLIDLGIAKRVEEPENLQITRTGTFVGKVRYASPEQFNSLGQMDYRSDLYSLGVVLYELLTGKFPIQGSDTSSMIAGHLFHPYLPFSESDPEGRLPEALRSALDRALSKSPEERFETAEAFSASLAAIQTAHPFDGGELAARFEQGRASFPPVPEHPEGAGEQALWELLERGASRSGTAASELADSAAQAGAKRKRRWGAVAAALVVIAAVAIVLATLNPWQSAKENHAEQGQALERVAITQPIDLGRYYALVIGNDTYGGGLDSLTTAVGDARAVADLLEARYGFDVQRLFNASFTQVLAGIEGYRTRLRPQDNLVIFYAGHGRLEGDTGYWLPVDAESDNTANWISNRDVSDMLLDLPATHVLVVADSCYSGTLTGAAASVPSQALSEEDRLAYIQRMRSQVARLALTSGGQVPVLDRGSGTHSVFTNAFLAVLEGNSDVLETALLYTRLRQRVSASVERLAIELEPGYSQVPEYATIPSAGDGGGEFFFAPAGLQAS